MRVRLRAVCSNILYNIIQRYVWRIHSMILYSSSWLSPLTMDVFWVWNKNNSSSWFKIILMMSIKRTPTLFWFCSAMRVDFLKNKILYNILCIRSRCLWLHVSLNNIMFIRIDLDFLCTTIVRLYELLNMLCTCVTIYATCPKVPNPSNIRPSSLHYRHMGVPLTILLSLILCVQKISIQHVLVPRNQCNHGNLSFYFTVDIVQYIFNTI